MAIQRSAVMASGDILRRLLQSHVEGDERSFRLAAEAAIVEERERNHRLLADDLDRILRGGDWIGGKPIERSASIDVPRDRERGLALVEVVDSPRSRDRLVVPAATRKRLERVIHENNRREVLMAAGLRPTQRLLFFGPPGCGKTLAAHYLADSLHLPLAIVRFDAIVSSFLGETSANLGKVFDFLVRGQFVALFDEFDAIGKDRDDPVEHGELKRVVNALLQLMDSFNGESLLLASTNHEGLLDSAIWRRFEEVFEFPLPTLQDRELMLRRFLAGFGTRGVDLHSVARRLVSAAGSDVERVATDAARRAVLNGRTELQHQDLDSAVADHLLRVRSVRSASSKPHTSSS